MEDKLLKVKHVFDKVKDMRSEITLLFNNLDGRISKLAEIYDEFIANTNLIRTPDVKAFIFSLDSFYFQNSLLRREYKYLKDYYNIIINRMYGEYYKLFKLITEYVDRSLIDNKLSEVLKHKNYPRYDDLDDEKVYDFKLITQVNEDIMSVITYLINILRDKETSLRLYTTNQNYGLNVNNFVSTFNYEVIVLQEQITLYEKYLDFFYHVHEKLLQRLITKVSVLEAQLNADIKFEGGLISKKKDNKVLFDELGMSGLNKKTARALRKSITGSESPFKYDDDSNIISNVSHIELDIADTNENEDDDEDTSGNEHEETNNENILEEDHVYDNLLLSPILDYIPNPPSSPVLTHDLENTMVPDDNDAHYEDDDDEDAEIINIHDISLATRLFNEHVPNSEEEDSSDDEHDDNVVTNIINECVDQILMTEDGTDTPHLTAKQKKNRRKNLKKREREKSSINPSTTM